MEGTRNNHSNMFALRKDIQGGFERTRPQYYRSSGVFLICSIDYCERDVGRILLSLSTNLQKDKRNRAQQAQGKKRKRYLLDPQYRSLSNLKFSAKGTKREVFGMTIPNELINDVIRGLSWESGKEEKNAISSKQLVDEFIDEGFGSKPRLKDTEEEILEKVLQESLTDAYPTQRGPLPPVVRETDTGKFQPLPEVSGKEEKVGHEDSTSLYVELGLSGSDTESDEEMPSVVRSGAQDAASWTRDPGN
ncbi:hypothetical protein Tco_0998993 [Tanacetum coccineum]